VWTQLTHFRATKPASGSGTPLCVSALELVLAIVMLVGLVGILVPILPGVALIAIAGVVWAIAEPRPIHWAVAGLMAGIAVAAITAAAVVPARRASAAGASRAAMVAGVIGMVVGFFVIPIVGALIGFPLGVFLGETLRLRDTEAAWATTLATVKGVGVGIVIQLVAGVAMIGLWVAAVLLD
jgi:uncharacterized protein YqgC (DUF456 family)